MVLFSGPLRISAGGVVLCVLLAHCRVKFSLAFFYCELRKLEVKRGIELVSENLLSVLIEFVVKLAYN